MFSKEQTLRVVFIVVLMNAIVCTFLHCNTFTKILKHFAYLFSLFLQKKL